MAAEAGLFQNGMNVFDIRQPGLLRRRRKFAQVGLRGSDEIGGENHQQGKDWTNEFHRLGAVKTGNIFGRDSVIIKVIQIRDGIQARPGAHGGMKRLWARRDA